MIDLKEMYDRCFAREAGDCTILKDIEICGNGCPFYKPYGCKDWVRVKQSNGEMLYTPEEYERSFKDEINDEPKAVYWRIKSVPVSKA